MPRWSGALTQSPRNSPLPSVNVNAGVCRLPFPGTSDPNDLGRGNEYRQQKRTHYFLFSATHETYEERVYLKKKENLSTFLISRLVCMPCDIETMQCDAYKCNEEKSKKNNCETMKEQKQNERNVLISKCNKAKAQCKGRWKARLQFIAWQKKRRVKKKSKQRSSKTTRSCPRSPRASCCGTPLDHDIP